MAISQGGREGVVGLPAADSCSKYRPHVAAA
jgi:hypothetical protein